MVTQADVKYICDLLEPVVAFRRSSNTPRSQTERDREKERERDRERGDKEKGDDSTTSSKDTCSTKSFGRPRGLRYLDLGFNRIGCANSSEILRAAARGDLECLDLAGNFSNRGHVFLAAVVDTLAAGGGGTCSGKSEGDDGSSDGGSDDGHGKAGTKGQGLSSRGSKNPLDLLSLHLPKQVPLLYTSHLKHLVSRADSTKRCDAMRYDILGRVIQDIRVFDTLYLITLKLSRFLLLSSFLHSFVPSFVAKILPLPSSLSLLPSHSPLLHIFLTYSLLFSLSLFFFFLLFCYLR